ncbi:glycosyltransferase [Haloarchaeobius sp. TZWSO28]|uniref:glycosyltransferase n=1 Tax=Haloarchaeobius sp. TZWSO28 TaxID=3446119 RepID=UPI003EB76E37
MRVALLEKTRTPYRPPLFEYLGEQLDLTVYYVGVTPGRRKWSPNDNAQNYEVRVPDSRDIGPFTVVSDLKRRLLLEGYDEVIVSAGVNTLPSSLLGASAAAELGARLTVWSEFIHTPWIRGQDRSLPIRLIKKPFTRVSRKLQGHLYSQADRVIAYSRLAKEAAISSGASHEQVTTAPQWYPPQELSEPKQTETTDSYRVLYVGSLSKAKGVDVLLDVALNCSDIEFAIAGTGPLEEAVAAASDRSPRIHKLGYIEGERKATEFTAADLLVLPTKHDAWGLVVNEAYIFGTPAITTTSAGAEMIVPESLTVPPGNPSALLNAIQAARRDRPTAPSQPTIEAMADPLL